MQIKKYLVRQGTLVLLFCFLLTLMQCKPAQESKTSLIDSTAVDTTAVLATPNNTELTGESQQTHDVIEYNGVAKDEISTALSVFSPFESVHELARLSIQIKDSLESLRENEKLTDPKDSLIFRPYEVSAYNALLNYKKLMESGSSKAKCPSLLQLSRVTEGGDSTAAILPPVGQSKLFKQGNFFFLGGTPFISKISNDDGDVFYDAKGTPETRFHVDTENTDFLLTSITHFNTVKFNITFGPPLDSYDSGPLEVNGVGTIIHTLVDRIPVLFLSKTGLVKGHFTAITLKLVPQNLGCMSDRPVPEFACAENVNENDILGIFIPYEVTNITTCLFSQKNNVWIIDLNGDGTADLAGVSSSYFGEASGSVLSEVLWFVNILGTWEIIDWGQDTDCT